MGLLELQGVEVVGESVIGGVFELWRLDVLASEFGDLEGCKFDAARANKRGNIPAKLYRLIFSVAMAAVDSAHSGELFKMKELDAKSTRCPSEDAMCVGQVGRGASSNTTASSQLNERRGTE